MRINKSIGPDLEKATIHRTLMNALDLLEDSVVIFDKKWHYLYVNKMGWKVLRRKKSEILGKCVWDVLPEIKNSEFARAGRKAMREQKKMTIEEYYPHSCRWYITKFYPLSDSLVMFIQDITDLKQAQLTNQQLFGELEDAMSTYWSEENRERREKHQKKDK